MGGLLLAASALVPAILLLWLLYSRDRNPEPKGMIVKTFLLGAVIVFPVIPAAMGLQALGEDPNGVWAAALAKAFLGAAIPEEAFKLLVIWWAWRKPAFDEPMDGMVYGAAASLGFAAFENLMYVGESGFGVAALRAFTAVPGHALTGVIMGAYAGQAKFAAGGRGPLLFTGFAWAVLLHGAYDAFLFTGTAWALMAIVVLGVEAAWARRLVKAMRGEQDKLDVLETFLAPSAAAGAPPVPASVPVPRRRAVPQRTAWAIAKISIGGTGASLGSMLVLLVLAASLDPGPEAPSQSDAAIAAAVFGVPTLLCFLLFWSGIRGPLRAPQGSS